MDSFLILVPELSHTKEFRSQKEDAEKEVLPKGTETGNGFMGFRGIGTEVGWRWGSQHPHPLWDQAGITLLSGTQRQHHPWFLSLFVYSAFQQLLRTSCVQALPGH